MQKICCLKREQWGQVTGEFDIDHFLPQTRLPELAVEYSNLIYSCRRCNAVKRDAETDDPFALMTNPTMNILPDGTLVGQDAAATRLILQLDLNSPRLVEWRITWMRIIELARERDRELWQRLVGFPADLPDLQRLRPPKGNNRHEGIAESWAERAKQGRLPDHY